MAIIIDTDVIIYGEKGGFDLRKWLTSKADEQFQVAAITVAELWHGVERASREYRDEREKYVRRVLSSLQILPYTEITALEHARIWARLESIGKMIGFYDLVVAATALEYDSGVATFNRRHFEIVPGLKVIVPK